MKAFARIFSIMAAAALCGCASQPAARVTDADGMESVSAITLSCGKPFALTQDCSIWSGPTKKINVGGKDIKVSGNADGTITVMFGQEKSTQATNLAYDLLKRELVERGYEITSVTPIESAGLMFGYAIETTEPNYQVWEEFAVEE